MVERKVIWSEKARNQFTQVLEFYNQRNLSKTYSLKIVSKVKSKIELLSVFPHIGRKSNDPELRVLIVEHFLLFYDINQDIEIVAFWDNRQEPVDRVDS